MDALFDAPEDAPWERRLRGWDTKSSSSRRLLVRSLAEAVAQGLHDAVAGEADAHELEVRATIEAIPVRLRLSMDGATVVEARVDNRRGLVALDRDPSKAASDDAWGDTRVACVAPGVFIEGRPEDVEAQERRLEEMGEAGAELLRGVERFEATSFTARPRELALVILVPEGGQPAPPERTVAAARWLAALAPAARAPAFAGKVEEQRLLDIAAALAP
jgi:hypothetical protein